MISGSHLFPIWPLFSHIASFPPYCLFYFPSRAGRLEKKRQDFYLGPGDWKKIGKIGKNMQDGKDARWGKDVDGKKETLGFWGPRAGKLRPRHAIEIWEVGCPSWNVVYTQENVVRGMPLRSGKLSATPATFVPRLQTSFSRLPLFSNISSFSPYCLFFPILPLFSHLASFFPISGPEMGKKEVTFS